jgi:hypothetical protein
LPAAAVIRHLFLLLPPASLQACCGAAQLAAAFGGDAPAAASLLLSGDPKGSASILSVNVSGLQDSVQAGLCGRYNAKQGLLI